MDQSKEEMHNEQIIVHNLWDKHKLINVAMEKSGHGGGDKRLHDKIFKSPDVKDPYVRSAGLKDGIMSILIGVGAFNSIESGDPIKIAQLTDFEPMAKRLI